MLVCQERGDGTPGRWPWESGFGSRQSFGIPPGGRSPVLGLGMQVSGPLLGALAECHMPFSTPDSEL